MRVVAALAATTLQRVIRDRTYLFFLVLLPLVLIAVIGSTVGADQRLRVGLVDEGAGPLGEELAAELATAVDLRLFDDGGGARTAVRRGVVDAAVVLPAGMDEALRRGDRADVVVVAEQAAPRQQAARSAVEGVVGGHAAAVQAATAVHAELGGELADHLERVGVERDGGAGARVEPVTVDAADGGAATGGFTVGAATMLVLFVFINSLAGGAVVVENRQLGMTNRVLAGPVSLRGYLAGEAAAQLTIALLQSLVIVVMGAVLFGVAWGHPVGAALLVGVWALVGAAAGMLAGALFRTPDQAGSVGPTVGIALAGLGGAMWPVELAPRPMQVAALATPHHWAVGAWQDLIAGGAGPADIVVELAVLVAFAAAAAALAVVLLRRSLAR